MSGNNCNIWDVQIRIIQLRFIVHHCWWRNFRLGGNELINLVVNLSLLVQFSLSKLFSLSSKELIVLLVLGGSVHPCWVHFVLFRFLTFFAPVRSRIAHVVVITLVNGAWCSLFNNNLSLWFGSANEFLLL